MYQTSAQNSNTIRFGSAKIEVGSSIGSLINLGLAEGIEFKEAFKPRIVKPDNGPEIQRGVTEHTATVKFDLWEANLTNLNLIRGGMDTLSSVAATPVTITDELHTLTGVNSERLNFKNGSTGIVSTVSVKDSSNGSAVLNVDYVLSVDPDGYTCITRISDSTVITSGEIAKVTYTYTPYASVSLSTGGLDTLNPRIVRLTNKDANNKIFQLTVYAAKNASGIELKLPSDDDDKVLVVPIELEGTIDITRTAGDQLFKIYDEQGVTA